MPGEKLFHLGFGGPPIIVVPLEDNLPAGQAFNKLEILEGLFQPHGPGDIPGDYHRVFRLYQPPPMGFQFFHIPIPTAENIHGFARRQGQVQVADCIKRHVSPPFH